jgi:replication factor A1
LGVTVKIADTRWNKLRHTFELVLTPGSIVRLVDDPTIDSNIPDIQYDFIPLRDISTKSSESFIGKRKNLFFDFNLILFHQDVIGIVDTCSDVISFTNRTSNRESKRREVTIIDEDTSISITIWDEQVNLSQNSFFEI